MSGSLGSFQIDDTLIWYVNAHTPSTGAAVAADAAPGYRVYEDETTTPILTGSMAALDSGNTTGFYSEQITLSAANGFEVGKSYCIRTTIVVGGVTGVDIHTLQIKAAPALASAVATLQTKANDIETDTQDIQNRLPAALTGSGNIKASVEEGANNVITSSVLAPNCITNSQLASNAIGSAQLANNAITASVLATDAAEEIADTVRARQLTEGYAVDGVAPTLEQALFLIMQGLLEFGISGTTVTVKKLDKATTAATYTLDDATNPTSRTRAT